MKRNYMHNDRYKLMPQGRSNQTGNEPDSSLMRPDNLSQAIERKTTPRSETSLRRMIIELLTNGNLSHYEFYY